MTEVDDPKDRVPVAVDCWLRCSCWPAVPASSAIRRSMVWWDMKRQPKFRTEGETGLFADGRNTRTPPEDTVAQGYLFDETAYNTGMEGAHVRGQESGAGDRGAAASGPVPLQHLLLPVP